MLRLKSNETGVGHVVAVLFIIAIGVIGAVAIRISSAQRYRFTAPPRTNFTSGSSAVCRSNGVIIVPPAGQSCSITQTGDGGVQCAINGVPTTCPGANTSTGVSSQGAQGGSYNFNNITTSTGNTGSAGSSVCTANGHSITGPNCSISSDANGTVCKINGEPRPCDY